MNYKYILEGRKPVPCPDVYKWAMWFETANRIVAYTMIDGVDICVSTVFMGIDISVGTIQPPLLFETMIFGGPHDMLAMKSATWEEAEKIHELYVIKAATPPFEDN
jgi:hypothetical protein